MAKDDHTLADDGEPTPPLTDADHTEGIRHDQTLAHDGTLAHDHAPAHGHALAHDHTLAHGQRTLAELPDTLVRDQLPPREQLPEMPAKVAGYVIIDELGRGGMGVVYKAYQPGANRVVALKMVLASAHAGADSRARFRLEAEAIAGLHHPNIVQLYEVGTEDGCPFFSLEYVDGRSLAQKTEGSPQPAKETARLIQTLAQAIQMAHERGIIHRDLKPANILLTQDGVPKITDFGLAKRLEDKDDGPTRSGNILGTPSYMAPEQAQGKTKDAGPAADIYSLGAILYDMLTGRPPFRGVTLFDTLQQVQNMEPLPPIRLQPTLPLDLQTICLKALEKEPAKRYQSAGAMAEDLRRYLAGEPILARPTSWHERTWKWTKRRPAAAGLVAVSLAGFVGLVTLGGLWLDSERRGAQEREALQRNQVRLEQEEADKARTQAKVEQFLRRRADENFQRAEKNFKRAKQAVDQMLSRVGQEGLAHIPQMEAIRREMLEKALGFYQEFLEEKGTDPAIRRDLARAHQRVADIREKLGEQPRAEKAYEAAMALLLSLTKESPADSGYQRDLADNSNQLANLLKDLRRNQEAEKLYRQTLALRQSLFDQERDSSANRFELARAHLNLGISLHLLGKTGGAEVEYQAGQKHLEELSQAHPGNFNFALELAAAQDVLGNLRRELGRAKEAQASLLQANARLKELGKEAGDRADYQEAVGLNHQHLGDFYRDTKPKVAEVYYEAAIGIRARLVKDFPRVPVYRQELATTHSNLAILLQSASRQAEADEAFGQALKIQTKAAADFPLLPDNRRRLASSYINYGNMLLGAGRLPEGEMAFMQAHDVLDLLSKKFPDVPEYQAEQATALLNLGAASLGSNHLAAAKSYFEKALAVREKLAVSYLDSPAYRQKLGEALVNYSALVRLLRDPEEALKTCRRAVGIFEDLQKADSTNPDYRRLLALALNNLGNFERDAKEIKAAEQSWTHASELFRRLVREFPANADYQQELARSLNDLGIHYVHEGRLPEADAVLGEAVAGFEMLFQRFPQRTIYRRDLAIGHDTLGGLRNKEDRAEEAVIEFKKALALLESPDIAPGARAELRQQILQTHRNLLNLLEALKRPAEAEKSWLRIVEEREKQVREFPKDPGQRAEAVNVLQELGGRTLGNGKYAQARVYYGKALAHLEVLAGQLPDEKSYPAAIYLLRFNLAQACLGEKDHAGAAKLMRQNEIQSDGQPRQDLAAAAILARCAGLVDKDAPLRKGYGDQAITFLTHAVEAGFRDVKSLQTEDWQALQGRDDFRAVLKILSSGKDKK